MASVMCSTLADLSMTELPGLSEVCSNERIVSRHLSETNRPALPEASISLRLTAFILSLTAGDDLLASTVNPCDISIAKSDGAPGVPAVLRARPVGSG